ncbi:MAG TPA: hypothetical protein VII75_03900 [Thermoanaerobaculia bacterium]
MPFLATAVVALFFQVSMVDLTRSSSVVFSGTVAKPHAALPSVPQGQNTAVVRVDDVLVQPATLNDLKSQLVTVRFRSGTSVASGQKALFFTTVYSVGKDVGLDSVGVVNDMPAEQGRAELAKARDVILDQDIAARLNRASAVVVGTVREVKSMATEQRISEHDPEWAVATVAVESVVKGNTAGGSVTLWFAGSGDPFYARWPKLKPGQRAIFIVQHEDPRLTFAQTRSVRKSEGPYVIDAADVQPLSNLDRVKRLAR